MQREDLIAFAQRDWSALAELKADHWLERAERLGSQEIFRVADELRRFVAAARPDWPSEGERAADLASHIAVAESLRRVAESRSR